MTITSARLYQAGAKDFVSIEGSLELTPLYQKDVDALRRFSPRALGIIVLYSILLVAMWLLSIKFAETPELFGAFLGALILGNLTANMRHVRNLTMFRYAKEGQGLAGRLEQSRWLTLKLSSVELLSFAALYLIVFLISGSWFFAGGALMCASSAVRHWIWADKARATAPTEEESSVGLAE